MDKGSSKAVKGTKASAKRRSGGGDLTGVAGYIRAADAEALGQAGGEGRIKLQFEAGSDKVVFYVKQADVEEVVPSGDPKKGYRFVQVILRPGSQVETEIQMLRDARNIKDPSLRRLTAAAVSTVSSISGS